MRVLVVDDEPLARQKLSSLLSQESDVQVVGEARDGLEAVRLIEEAKPDLALLDVQMPELDGFGVIEQVGAERMPAVVFVTAYDSYALRAFDVHAVDYLLKPFDRSRLKEALQRARREVDRRQTGLINEKLLALIEDLKPERKPLERLVVKSSGRVFFLKTEEIDWIDSAGNYVRLHVNGESHLLRETMTNLEGKLDAERFVRIHRSTMVNIERIKELQQVFHGDYVVILQNGQRLALSRTYRDKLQEILGREL
jgi:two-component system LytT family response regulator